jgi:DNA-binding MarR family transcriptional regulator
MILRILTKKGPRTAPAIIRAIDEDAARVMRILDVLVKDGLIKKMGQRFSIA